MSAGKHTPGPWNNYQGDDIYCVYSESGKKICSVEPVDIVGWNAVHREEADANEALIVAAPDLLEALQNLENDSGAIPGHAWQMIQSAIAKATGSGK